MWQLSNVHTQAPLTFLQTHAHPLLTYEHKAKHISINILITRDLLIHSLVLTELIFNFVSFPLFIWGFIARKNKNAGGLTLQIRFDLYS